VNFPQYSDKEDVMMQRWYWGVPLSAALFACSLTSAYAAIHLNLETPPAGLAASGIGLVRGWAFADNGNPVTVTLRLDGLPLSGFSVDCCSARQDVQTSVSGAPLDTGFGATVNYGDVTAGPHTIGVAVSATGETSQVIDHAVVVARPGNVPLVGTFDLSSATCTVEQPQNDILINNVKVSASGGTPLVTTVREQYQTSTQAFVITDASGGPALTNFKANLNGSQEVPTPTSLTCTGTGSLVLNPSDNSITCSLTFSNLTGSAIAAHIHQDPPGAAGPIIIPLALGAGGTSPATCPAPTTLTADQLTALRQGNLYFNVHTNANQAGECRGQIVAGP
jgi:CHRD domain-containing protein